MILNILISFSFGACVGILSALLGIGGGIIIVPVLVAVGFEAKQAVAVSALAIVLTSASATFKNWKQGGLQFSNIFWICCGSLATAPLGSWLASKLSEATLLLLFTAFVATIFATMNKRSQLGQQTTSAETLSPAALVLAKLFTGALTGLCSGFFGIGGGVILVPLQILLLKCPLKLAIKYSLSIIAPTALIATVSHAALGNLIWEYGLLIGSGGIVGAQIGTTLLQRGSENFTRRCFQALLLASMLVTIGKAIWLS